MTNNEYNDIPEIIEYLDKVSDYLRDTIKHVNAHNTEENDCIFHELEHAVRALEESIGKIEIAQNELADAVTRRARAEEEDD